MGMRGRGVVRIVAAGLLLHLTVLAAPAAAHDPTVYIGNQWFPQLTTFTYVNNFPGGAYRDRVQAGAGDWPSGVTGNPGLNYANSSQFWWFADTCSGNGSGIHWEQIDGAFDPNNPNTWQLGTTSWCRAYDSPGAYGPIVKVQVRFDMEENWWTGTGTAPQDTWDLESIAAHEFGHAF